MMPASEAAIRMGFFVATFGAVALWEIVAPRRLLAEPRARRWASNLALLAIDAAAVRLLFPAAAVGMALFARGHGWGLLNYRGRPEWIAVAVSVIVLDLAIWMQHVMMHAVPALWRLHRVHHADLDFDLTTGTRFHPLEIVLSMLFKLAVVAALGAPALAVLIFEVLLNATSVFNHGNVRMPARTDSALRLLVVTPDMHRVHHSIQGDETNSNFGFNLPWWDRLFGTYRGQPRAGHEAMTVGIRAFRDPRDCSRLWGMLRLPFLGDVSDTAIGRRDRSE
jgi:sterol desaturase/sphingolipid hydroxylase (fatty acid hydroxylase superfamily)